MMSAELTDGAPNTKIRSLFSRRHLFFAVPVFFLTSGLILFLLFSFVPLDGKLKARADSHAINQPIELELSQAVKAGFSPTISPAVEGEWRYDSSVLGVRGLAFVPAGDGLKPATIYILNLANLKRVTGQELPDQQYQIKTEQAPSVASVFPEKGTKNIAADSTLSVSFSGPNRGMRKLRIEVTPKTDLVAVDTVDDTTFGWKAKDLLQQGKAYEIRIFDERSNEPERALASAKFTTSKEPKIIKTNQDFLYPNEPIEIAFDQPMKQTGDIVQCSCSGKGAWKDAQTFRYLPEKIEVDKTYKYSVLKGARAVSGGIVARDRQFAVKTPGAVQAAIDQLGTKAKLDTPITVIFDQPVNRSSAESKFVVTPKADGRLTWKDDETMVFSPQKFEQQKNYEVRLASGITPLKFGKPSDKPFTATFVTEPKTTKLNVPVLAQQHPSSCEAASLRMALAFRGINDSDASIVRKMGYNGKHKKGNSWDDPNQMYVGNIDGSQSRYEGYGAYGAPIAKAARAYGRGAHVQYSATPGYVAEQILSGRPVVIIGTVSHMSPQYISWNGPAGKVHAWMGMHARTVVGVVGSADNPQGFWVNDPYRGTHEYWTPERLASDLATVPQVPSQVVVIK